MPQSFDPVFDEWYTKKCIGNGTDGRVYIIEKKGEDGEIQRSVLKTIRISDNRSESKSFNSINEVQAQQPQETTERMISNITDNIETIKKVDGGKYFVKYEQWDTRPTSDNKGTVILIRLEEMRSLSYLFEKFSFTLEETIRLGISVCRALCRCRDFGYIYPNLKPDNILFDKNGICKLGDFGSFSSLEPSKSSVAFKRTQYYMAPEFIKTGKINCTADTYSLGLVLYMLTNRGRLPFTELWPQEVTVNGLDRSKENRLNAYELPKPATASDELFKIISKACAFKEEERYLSPKQMLADLKNVYNNKPTQKVEFEEIYSFSDDSTESTYDESTRLDENYDDISGIEKAPINDDDEKKPIELRREISIPDVTPMDYGFDKKIQKRRRPVAYPQLPKTTKADKVKRANIKAVAAIVIAIICVLVLLVVSIALRSHAESEENISNVSNAACVNLIADNIL